MRQRRLIVVVGAVLAVSAAVAFAGWAAARGVEGSPAETSAAYFQAWEDSDVVAMSRLVDRPPADFRAWHDAMTGELGVERLRLEPGRVRVTGEETAEVPFSGVRELEELGEWPFAGTLRLAVREREWKVLWQPETLHPLLKDGGTIQLVELFASPSEPLTREGDKIPHRSYADAHLLPLRDDREVAEPVGRVLVAKAPGRPDQELLRDVPEEKGQRTTLSRAVQAAAARALDARADAAIVAIDPRSGEILAVADRLRDSYSAFKDTFPPGSAFKVITAAALLGSGLRADDQVPCPGTYTVPGHSGFRNDGEVERGVVSFTDAFAHSCNTTFIEQALSRLDPTDLSETAARWGFGRSLPTGADGFCGKIQDSDDPDQRAIDAIGQGTVAASPLCMAAAAAAVQNGTWRPPRLVSERAARLLDGPAPEPVELDPEVVAALRTMMRAVVDHGTAAGAGLPADLHGKTGTAETADGEPHAWFIGYRGDLAFCVFVRHGGSSVSAALPIASRFLNGL
ncbi:penicillin-binding transpeptidase domain-containing protein [Nonomuraea sp. MCN248]|uniref:Penicillin-binding transpeptidase domain-containing protein n=1 Tax=Nonomuraea corallina TaxID=2989783 RepID=A0ABT4SHL7_9ACTN|nr:penicillin-binding transpeptidase domain-containing protein [Nonomuraea corallina]MDA0636480.1 penicillin-binding transpeptidase domain-containing protein [Nonomuraea corallina]